MIYHTKLDFVSKNLDSIISVIISKGGVARIVGGAVRDSLLGIECSDIDIATDLIPEILMKIFSDVGMKVIPTGIAFGTVTVVVGDESFEITTLRRDVRFNGRHPIVEYTDDFSVDAARRDFTINAMNYDIVNHTIYDYFTGIEDLKNRIVKFIGDPDQRIKEDYLRILRFFRFSARFSNLIEQDGLNACIHNIDGLKRLSMERIKSELDGILMQSNFMPILKAIADIGIWKLIFGNQINLKILDNLIKLSHDIKVSIDLSTIYASCLDGVEFAEVSKLTRLKFSVKDAKRIVWLLNLSLLKTFQDIKIALVNEWLETKLDNQTYLYLASNPFFKDIQELCSIMRNFDHKPVFPINANDLKMLGLSGSDIGQYLRELKKSWILSDFSLNKEELIDLIK